MCPLDAMPKRVVSLSCHLEEGEGMEEFINGFINWARDSITMKEGTTLKEHIVASLMPVMIIIMAVMTVLYG